MVYSQDLGGQCLFYGAFCVWSPCLLYFSPRSTSQTVGVDTTYRPCALFPVSGVLLSRAGFLLPTGKACKVPEHQLQSPVPPSCSQPAQLLSGLSEKSWHILQRNKSMSWLFPQHNRSQCSQMSPPPPPKKHASEVRPVFLLF